MKNKIIIISVVILFIAGLMFIFYPTFSDFWNNYHQSKAIANYVDDVENLDDQEYSLAFKEAEEYNKQLTTQNITELTDEQLEVYNSMLNISNNGIMGYVEIPKIDVKLPIYHGTSDDVLQVAIGHVESSSLPIGGESTHTVLMGHRGLPSAKLFTSIDKLEIGDIFYIYSLNNQLAYQVDDISVVEPQDLEKLNIVENEDYATLVTCTPYGINSHRLLVRGKRIEIPKEPEEPVEEKTSFNWLWILILIILFIFFLILIIILMKRKKDEENNQEEM